MLYVKVQGAVCMLLVGDMIIASAVAVNGEVVWL
jgi:hypothetical protein